MQFLLHLFGAVALLLWALRMVRTGIMRAYGSRLRHWIGIAMTNRFRALGAGTVTSLLLQSSSATGLLTSSFAARGMMGAAATLAIMLGADLGTSLVTQAYTLPIYWLSPLLILVGYVMFNKLESTRLRDLGRAGIGLGLVLLALHLITDAAEPIRDAPLLPQILALMSNSPLFGVVAGGVLTVLCASSVAVILLIASFVKAGLLPVPLALAFVLGANLCADVMAMLTSMADPPEARRVQLGNMIFRAVGVLCVLPFLPLIVPILSDTSPNAMRQILDFHTGFNLLLVLVFIGLVGPVARLTQRILPDAARPDDPSKPRYLAESAMDSPSVALANASREALRMGDAVGEILRLSLEALRSDDRKVIKLASELDSQVDRLNEAIKLYLTKVSRDHMDPTDHRRVIDLITFTTNLEHIGDIVDKNLMELAAKKVKYKLKFSPEGSQDIEEIHDRLNGNLQLAMNVFMTGDINLARKLFAEKQAFRELERQAAESHLERLRSGRIESIQTSSLHLDILRDLKRINSHLALVAQPILEAAGELSPSRLKAG
ncbi:MAG TPA: Na/Pi cotransporter family protein [Candidatus Binatia bacterium]|nr:Na/Pi cotransporter family protein [Candidatus Binatia bacterium]